MAGNSRFRTAFDLARFIANGEQCDLWATGKTIHCQPTGANNQSVTLNYTQQGAVPYAQAPVMSLQLERDMLIAKGVTVQVIGWDSRQRARHIYVWSAGSNGPSSVKLADTKGTLHTFNRPDMRMDEAKAFAKQKYDEIVAQARTVTFDMPGDLTLTPRQSLILSGTGTTWDSSFRVESIERRFSPTEGFDQTVILRNRDTTDEEDQSA